MKDHDQTVANRHDLPNAAGIVPNGSEDFGSVPQDSESIRQPSETPEQFTLTVRDVTRMLEHEGVARTERSVVNWCQVDAHGLSRLNARKDPNDGRYYITKESVYRVIEEEHSKARQAGRNPSIVSERRESVSERDEHLESEAAAKSESRIEELERELRDKDIVTRVQKSVIERLQRECDTFGEERQKYVEALSQTNRQLGRLEGQLKQLPADHQEKAQEISTEGASPKGDSDPSLSVIAVD